MLSCDRMKLFWQKTFCWLLNLTCIVCKSRACRWHNINSGSRCENRRPGFPAVSAGYDASVFCGKDFKSGVWPACPCSLQGIV